MGNPAREEWVWLRHQYNDIKGHAKWEIIRKLGVLVAWCAAIVRWIQHAPLWEVCGLVVVVPTACWVFARWLSRESKTHYPAETPSWERNPIPPPGIYSTVATEPKTPTLDRKAFEVLKWFSTFPRNASAPVSYVAQVHGLDSSAALACVQELWGLQFVETVAVAPGEWNGRYAITDKGFYYVRTHAT